MASTTGRKYGFAESKALMAISKKKERGIKPFKRQRYYFANNKLVDPHRLKHGKGKRKHR